MRRLLPIFFVLVFVVSCNPISMIKELLFKEDQQEETKKEASKKKEGPKTPAAVPDVEVEREEKEPSKRKNLQKPPPSVEKESSLPLIPVDHFGGVPTSLDFDDYYVYVGFGRKLTFLDHSLKVQGFVNLEAPARRLFSKKGTDELLLYIEESRHILEIIRLPKGASPEVVKSFQVDGPFDFFPHASELFVYLSDRVQILDLSRPEEVSVISEIFLPTIRQAYPLGDYFYLAQGFSLNVVSQKTLSVLSSISLETDFTILGSWNEEGDSYLVLALKAPQTGKIKVIHFMPLIPEGGGFANFGQGVELKTEVDEAILNQGSSILYLLQGGKLDFFDLKNRVALQGPKAPVESISYVRGGDQFLYALSPFSVGRFEYQILNEGSAKEEPDVPALAVGAGYQWKKKTMMLFPGLVDGLILIDNQSVLIFNGLAKDHPGVPPLFTSNTFSTDTSNLKPLWFPKKEQVDLTLARSSSRGVFLYDKKGRNLFLVKKGSQSVEPLNLPPLQLVGMDVSFDGQKTRFYLMDGKKLIVYLMESPQVFKKEGELSLAEGEAIRVFNKTTRGLVACGKLGVCLLDLANTSKLKVITTLKPSKDGDKARGVVLSPRQTTGYVFFESSNGNYIAVLNLKGEAPHQVSTITDMALSLEQFRGITFSAGGQKLIVPNSKGLRFFDVTDLTKPILLFDWPLGKTFFADVAHRGMTVCAALGQGGVECADLNQ